MTHNTEAVEKLEEIVCEFKDELYPCDVTAQAILAAIQVDPLACVKPKPLGWLATHEYNYAAKAFGGEYLIEGRNLGYLWWTPTFRGAGTPADTLEAAQAAAYDDLCNRVKELF